MMDIKNIGVIVSIAVVGVSVVSTYAVLLHRVGEIEKQVAAVPAVVLHRIDQIEKRNELADDYILRLIRLEEKMNVILGTGRQGGP